MDLLVPRVLLLLALATVFALFGYALRPRKQQRQPALSAVGAEETESRSIPAGADSSMARSTASSEMESSKYS
jgi:hypothetical protein